METVDRLWSFGNLQVRRRQRLSWSHDPETLIFVKNRKHKLFFLSPQFLHPERDEVSEPLGASRDEEAELPAALLPAQVAVLRQILRVSATTLSPL